MAYLFSYGTLQRAAIQRSCLGRTLDGTEDSLPGFRLGSVKVPAAQGTQTYPAVFPAGDDSAVAGVVYEIFDGEWEALDRYEGPQYRRRFVTLGSGVRAWVYQGAVESPSVLVVFVPVEQAEAVKDALFEAGAGRWGNYDRCSFESRGRGQFRPLPGAQPFTGSVGTVENVDELRIEMLVDPGRKSAVEAALRSAHPYEEPAFYWQPSGIAF